MRGEHDDGVAYRSLLSLRNTPACAGNTARFASAAAVFTGTPPHARGTQRHGRVGRIVDRNTPACAGNTPSSVSPSPATAEHPRMRGEHHFVDIEADDDEGTPPHARGTRVAGQAGRVRVGNTPACAGNTETSSPTGSDSREHPRMRGEHSASQTQTMGSSGTPPHARGTQASDDALPRAAGNTPACAGNTLPMVSWRVAKSEHPRMRGEHSSSDGKRNGRNGTPPHARGTPHHRLAHHMPGGNTPACAGNTGREVARQARHPEHPRMRGEHAQSFRDTCSMNGTPPHARGTLRPPLDRHSSVRNTPACAGNTCSRRPPSAPSREHPRMRGEHGGPPYRPRRGLGTPPHARGTPCRRAQRSRRAWNTPACAGNTSAAAALRLSAGTPPHARGTHFLTCASRDQLGRPYSLCFVLGPLGAESVDLRPKRRYLAALLHPCRRAGFGVNFSFGCRMRVIPSKSTGRQWWSWTAKDSRCSPGR